jgi:hypothetical protein
MLSLNLLADFQGVYNLPRTLKCPKGGLDSHIYECLILLDGDLLDCFAGFHNYSGATEHFHWCIPNSYYDTRLNLYDFK